MKLILFGATGMIGQAALVECLKDSGVTEVLSVSRRATGVEHPKLRELLHSNFDDFSSVADQLTGYDGCLYCLGISSNGVSEADYTQITYGYAMAAGTVLARQNPGMTLAFISGAGTSETARAMWARVKGKTEAAMLALPFKAAYMFRPALIRPMKGVRSRTTLYRVGYAVMGAVLPLVGAVAPRWVSRSDELGVAMIAAVRSGAPKSILETPDINALAALAAAATPAP